jgi:hypothetical protein
MSRVAHQLSALDERGLAHPGKGRNVFAAMGGVSGLGLRLSPSGAKTWLLRVAVGGRRREIGIGAFPDVTLAQARDRAREAKDQIRRCIDPVEEHKAARAAHFGCPSARPDLQGRGRPVPRRPRGRQ